MIRLGLICLMLSGCTCGLEENYPGEWAEMFGNYTARVFDDTQTIGDDCYAIIYRGTDRYEIREWDCRNGR